MEYIIKETQVKTLIQNVDFDSLYREYYKPMYNYVCMKYANNDRDLAKDYCQIGFMKVYQNLNKFDGTGNIGGWIRRVLTNEIINELRKKKLDVNKDIDVEKTDIEIEPTETGFMGGRISKEQLKDAVDKLPQGYKTILLLYYFSNLNHREIASVLGIDGGTSRSQISKAKESLKNHLKNYLK
jgi:RNA polymerase sigma factor (sigma-70 family)